MCGRYVAATPVEQLTAFFGAEFAQEPLAANYNVAPTNDVYAVAERNGRRVVEVLRWGLVPSWADDPKIGSRMINARSETIFEKPAFRSLVLQRRVLVPMTGFYEWLTTPSEKGKPLKTPMFIHRTDGLPLVAAGLESVWRSPHGGPDAAPLRTCTVLTTSANATMMPVHDRMPVVLEQATWSTWLDPSLRDPATIGALLRPAGPAVLEMYQVGNAVNNVRHQGPELLSPVSA